LKKDYRWQAATKGQPFGLDDRVAEEESRKMDWLRLSSLGESGAALGPQFSSALSRIAAIRLLLMDLWQGYLKGFKQVGLRRGRFTPTEREVAYSTIEGCRRK